MKTGIPLDRDIPGKPFDGVVSSFHAAAEGPVLLKKFLKKISFLRNSSFTCLKPFYSRLSSI